MSDHYNAASATTHAEPLSPSFKPETTTHNSRFPQTHERPKAQEGAHTEHIDLNRISFKAFSPTLSLLASKISSIVPSFIAKLFTTPKEASSSESPATPSNGTETAHLSGSPLSSSIKLSPPEKAKTEEAPKPIDAKNISEAKLPSKMSLEDAKAQMLKDPKFGKALADNYGWFVKKEDDHKEFFQSLADKKDLNEQEKKNLASFLVNYVKSDRASNINVVKPLIEQMNKDLHDSQITTELGKVDARSQITYGTRDLGAGLQKIRQGEMKSADREQFISQLSSDFKSENLANMSNVRNGEFFDNICEKSNKNISPNVINLAQRSNSITNNVTYEILSGKTPDEVKNSAEFFLELADRSVEKGDFATAHAIMAAFNSTALGRLVNNNDPKINLSPQHKFMLSALNNKFSFEMNYKNQRQVLEREPGNRELAIPINAYLTDLTFLNVKAPPFKDGTINTNSFNVLAQIQNNINRGKPDSDSERSTEYNLSSFKHNLNDAELYEMSVKMFGNEGSTDLSDITGVMGRMTSNDKLTVNDKGEFTIVPKSFGLMAGRSDPSYQAVNKIVQRALDTSKNDPSKKAQLEKVSEFLENNGWAQAVIGHYPDIAENLEKLNQNIQNPPAKSPIPFDSKSVPSSLRGMDAAGAMDKIFSNKESAAEIGSYFSQLVPEEKGMFINQLSDRVDESSKGNVSAFLSNMIKRGAVDDLKNNADSIKGLLNKVGNDELAAQFEKKINPPAAPPEVASPPPVAESKFIAKNDLAGKMSDPKIAKQVGQFFESIFTTPEERKAFLSNLDPESAKNFIGHLLDRATLGVLKENEGEIRSIMKNAGLPEAQLDKILKPQTEYVSQLDATDFNDQLADLSTFSPGERDEFISDLAHDIVHISNDIHANMRGVNGPKDKILQRAMEHEINIGNWAVGHIFNAKNKEDMVARYEFFIDLSVKLKNEGDLTTYHALAVAFSASDLNRIFAPGRLEVSPDHQVKLKAVIDEGGKLAALNRTLGKEISEGQEVLIPSAGQFLSDLERHSDRMKNIEAPPEGSINGSDYEARSEFLSRYEEVRPKSVMENNRLNFPMHEMLNSKNINSAADNSTISTQWLPRGVKMTVSNLANLLREVSENGQKLNWDDGNIQPQDRGVPGIEGRAAIGKVIDWVNGGHSKSKLKSPDDKDHIIAVIHYLKNDPWAKGVVAGDRDLQVRLSELENQFISSQTFKGDIQNQSQMKGAIKAFDQLIDRMIINNEKLVITRDREYTFKTEPRTTRVLSMRAGMSDPAKNTFEQLEILSGSLALRTNPELKKEFREKLEKFGETSWAKDSMKNNPELRASYENAMKNVRQ